MATPCVGARIAVLKSRNLAPYDEAIDGLSSSLPQHEVEVHELEGDLDKAATLLGTLQESPPDAYVAVGTVALRAVKGVRDRPVYFTMVSRPERHVGGDVGNIGGVSLDVDMRGSFEMLRRIKPTATVVGVLYNPKTSTAEVEAASAAVEGLGIRLVPVGVTTAKQVPKAVRGFEEELDALWLLPNKSALTPRALEFVMVEMTKQGVPVIGMSQRYTKAGALFSLDPNYRDLGAQTGDLIERMQSAPGGGGSVPVSPERRDWSLPTEAPRALSLRLNMKVAKLLDLVVPSDVVEEATTLIK